MVLSYMILELELLRTITEYGKQHFFQKVREVCHQPQKSIQGHNATLTSAFFGHRGNSRHIRDRIRCVCVQENVLADGFLLLLAVAIGFHPSLCK